MWRLIVTYFDIVRILKFVDFISFMYFKTLIILIRRSGTYWLIHICCDSRRMVPRCRNT